MRSGRKTVLIVALTAFAVMALGVGYAAAQTDDAGTAAADEQQFDRPFGGGGPGPGPGMIGRGRGGHMLGGEVLRVEGDTITIKTFKDEEKTVNVNDETNYRKPPDGEATLADVQPGVTIGVALNKAAEGESLIARGVIIGMPEPGERGDLAVGEVVSIDGDKLVLKTADGSTQEVTLPQITPGMRMGVATAPDGTVKGLMYDPPERPFRGPEGEPAPEDGAGA